MTTRNIFEDDGQTVDLTTDDERAIEAVYKYLQHGHLSITEDCLSVESIKYDGEGGWRALVRCEDIPAVYFEAVKTYQTSPHLTRGTVAVSAFHKSDMIHIQTGN